MLPQPKLLAPKKRPACVTVTALQVVSANGSLRSAFLIWKIFSYDDILEIFRRLHTKPDVLYAKQGEKEHVLPSFLCVSDKVSNYHNVTGPHPQPKSTREVTWRLVRPHACKVAFQRAGVECAINRLFRVQV